MHATSSLQTMIGVRSESATHNPRWRRKQRRAEANHRRAAPQISGQRPSAWLVSRKTSGWPLGGGKWRLGYSGSHHCTLGWGIWRVGRVKVVGHCRSSLPAAAAAGVVIQWSNCIEVDAGHAPRRGSVHAHGGQDNSTQVVKSVVLPTTMQMTQIPCFIASGRQTNSGSTHCTPNPRRHTFICARHGTWR